MKTRFIKIVKTIGLLCLCVAPLTQTDTNPNDAIV